jgi:hypothetical protein
MNNCAVLRTILSVICLGMLSSCVVSADEIQNPVPKTNVEWHASRKIFFAGTAALAISSSFDWTTTVGCLQRGCQEGNSRWAIGQYPNNPGIIRFASAFFAMQTTAFYLTERSRHRWLRWAGRAYVAYSVETHLISGFRNRDICQPLGTCRSGRR